MLRYLEAAHTARPTDADADGRPLRAGPVAGRVCWCWSPISSPASRTSSRELLRWLRGAAGRSTVVHVVDEAEVAPAAASSYLAADGPAGVARPPVELLEIESGERLRLTPSDEVLRRYGDGVDELAGRRREQRCETRGPTYVRLLTDWPFETVVLRTAARAGVVA